MAKQHLLLVDADARDLRILEVSLRKAGFTVTSAIHGQDALQKVEISRPALIVADTKLPDMDGFELCRALKSDPRFKSVPLIFLTHDPSAELQVQAVRVGGDDWLVRPISVRELIARVRMMLGRAEWDQQWVPGKSGFSGDLETLEMVDLVQMFEIGRRTGEIRIQNHRCGQVFFREGKVVDAELGPLRGEAAFYKVLNASEGKFELRFGSVERPDQIMISTQALLMEGMRRLEEHTRLLEQLPPLESVLEIDGKRLAMYLSEIPDEVNDVLRLFDGRRTVQAVVEESSLEELAALGAVSKLYFEGLLCEVAPRQMESKARSPVVIHHWLSPPLSRKKRPGAVAEPNLPAFSAASPSEPVLLPPVPASLALAPSEYSEPLQSTPKPSQHGPLILMAVASVVGVAAALALWPSKGRPPAAVSPAQQAGQANAGAVAPAPSLKGTPAKVGAVAPAPSLKGAPAKVGAVPSASMAREPSPVSVSQPLPGAATGAPQSDEYALIVQEAKTADGLGQFRTAVEQYRKALQLKPDSLDAKLGLGVALVRSDPRRSRYREAERLLEQVVRTDRNNTQAWLALGIAYQFTEQTPQAVDAYRRYLSLAPDGEAAADVRATLTQLGY